MNTFGLYLIGYIIFVIGVAVAAGLLGAPIEWIITGAVILIGLGVIFGVRSTKRPDPPADQ